MTAVRAVPVRAAERPAAGAVRDRDSGSRCRMESGRSTALPSGLLPPVAAVRDGREPARQAARRTAAMRDACMLRIRRSRGRGTP